MHISTSYWIPKLDERGQPTGMLSYHSQKTMTEVRKQVEAVLANVRDDEGVSALDQMEWLATEPRQGASLCPKGEPFAALRHGTSEGYLAEIFVLDRHEGVARGIATAKFLSNKAFVYRVAEALNEACYEGGFANDPPPL